MRWLTSRTALVALFALVCGGVFALAEDPLPFLDIKYDLHAAATVVDTVPVTVQLPANVEIGNSYVVIVDDKFDVSEHIRKDSILCSHTGHDDFIVPTSVKAGADNTRIVFPVKVAAAKDAVVTVACSVLYPGKMHEEVFQAGAAVQNADGVVLMESIIIESRDIEALPEASFLSAARGLDATPPFINADVKISATFGPVPAPTGDFARFELEVELPGMTVGQKPACSIAQGPTGATCSCTTAGKMLITLPDAAAAVPLVSASCGVRTPNTAQPSLQDLLATLYGVPAAAGSERTVASVLRGVTLPALDPADAGATATMTFEPSTLGVKVAVRAKVTELKIALAAKEIVYVDMPQGAAINAEALTCAVLAADGERTTIPCSYTAPENPEEVVYVRMVLPDGAAFPVGSTATFEASPVLMPMVWSDALLDVEFVSADDGPVRASSLLTVTPPGQRKGTAAWTQDSVLPLTPATFTLAIPPFERPLPEGAALRLTLPLLWAPDAGTQCTMASKPMTPLAMLEGGAWETRTTAAQVNADYTLVCGPFTLPSLPQDAFGGTVSVHWSVNDDASSLDTLMAPAILSYTFPNSRTELAAPQAKATTTFTVLIDQLPALHKDDRVEIDLSAAPALRYAAGGVADCTVGDASAALAGSFDEATSLLLLDYAVGDPVKPSDSGFITVRCPATLGNAAPAATVGVRLLRRPSAFEDWRPVGANSAAPFPAVLSEDTLGVKLFETQLPEPVVSRTGQGLRIAVVPLPIAVPAGAALTLALPAGWSVVPAKDDADACQGTFDTGDRPWSGVAVRGNTTLSEQLLKFTFKSALPLDLNAALRLECYGIVPPAAAALPTAAAAELIVNGEVVAHSVTVQWPEIFAAAPGRQVARTTATVSVAAGEDDKKRDDAVFGIVAFGRVAAAIAEGALLAPRDVVRHVATPLSATKLQLTFSTERPVGFTTIGDVVTRVNAHTAAIKAAMAAMLPEFTIDAVRADLDSVPAHCFDAAKTDTETDVDCGGGECHGCQTGKACQINGDCLSSACDKKTMKCVNINAATGVTAGGAFALATVVIAALLLAMF